MAAQETRPHSPKRALARSSMAPPETSDMAERSTGFPERCERREYTMPMDHDMAPTSTATAASNTPGAERKVSPWNKRPTPTRPRIKPLKSVTFMRHLRSAAAEDRKIQMGSLA